MGTVLAIIGGIGIGLIIAVAFLRWLFDPSGMRFGPFK